MKGSEFIEKAKAIYNDVGMESVDVDGIGVVYYKPMTLSERALIQKLSKSNSELPASTIVVKALDENGDRMFGNMSKADLIRGIDANTLDEVAAKIVDIRSVEDRVQD